MFTHEFMMRHPNEKISIRALAIEAGVHPNKLRRAMIKAGIPLLSAKESMKAGFESGRLKPTINTLSEEHRMKLSVANKGKKRVAQTKNNYILKKQTMARSEAAIKNREACKKGSKFERMLLDRLTSSGYNVTHQHPIDKYKIDLWLPDYRLAVEIDGIAHREPIYGVDRLERTIAKDKLRDERFKNQGIHVLRVFDLQKCPSLFNCVAVIAKIEEVIKEIGQKEYVYSTMEIK